MKDLLKKKDIYRLSEYFELPKNEVWDLMRKGTEIILGEKYLFVEYKDGKYSTGLSCFGGYESSIISIIHIVTGNKEEYSYCFFELHKGDALNSFAKGINNAHLMYEFKTGKKFNFNKL
tara:strand:+ start:11623 stop:11979 length:357 start_codon:yes stop_codon:yes gene_type:complete